MLNQSCSKQVTVVEHVDKHVGQNVIFEQAERETCRTAPFSRQLFEAHQQQFRLGAPYDSFCRGGEGGGENVARGRRSRRRGGMLTERAKRSERRGGFSNSTLREMGACIFLRYLVAQDAIELSGLEADRAFSALEQLTVHIVDASPVRVQFGLHLFDAFNAQPPCTHGDFVWACRQGVNLAFLDHLEPVFDGPEKHIRARQRVEDVLGNEPGFLKRLEALPCISLPQLWVPGAGGELAELW